MARRVSVEYTANVASYLSNVARAEAGTKQFADRGNANMDRHDRQLARSAGSVAKFGAAGAVALGGLAVAGGVAFGVSAVQKANTFDKSMRQVGIQTGQTGEQLKAMTDLALDMGKVTSFSAQGASDAMLALAKGGLSAAEMKAGVLGETLTLATAGGLELGAAAGYMVQGLNTFGLKAEDAGRVSAALAGAANASTASVEDMGIALSQVGPGADLAGLSIEDTTAALAAFTNNGMKGSDAGTSLKTMLSSLQPSTDKASDALRRMGIVTEDGSNKFFDAQGNVKSMAEVAGLLEKGLDGQTRAQKMATLEAVFGSDAYRAAAILAKEGADGIGKYVAATSNSAAAGDLAKSATQGYSGALERFQGAVETAQIQLGLKFLPILTEVLDYLSGPGIETFQSLGGIIGDTFGPQLDAASGGLTRFIDYLSTHQADVIRTFQSWGNGIFDFGIAISQTAAGGLRQIGDFTLASTASVLNMVGTIIKGFDSIPLVDMSDSVAEFGRLRESALKGAAGAKSDLYSLATGIDTKVVPSINGMKDRFNAASRQQIVTAEQRDAVQRAGQAIEKLGTQTDGSQVKLKTFNDINRLASGEQKALRARLDEARGALGGQVGAMENANASQRDLTGAWKRGRDALYEEFRQMGLSRKEAGRLADQYAGTRPKVDAVTAATDRAKRAVDDIGTASNGTRIRIKSWSDVSRLGADEQRRLEDRIRAARQRMLEQRDAGIKAGDSQKDLTDRWNKGREALRREFVQMGLSKDEAKRLTDRYGKIPGKKETKVSQPGMSDAIGSTRSLKDRINEIPTSKKVMITFSAKTFTGAGGVKYTVNTTAPSSVGRMATGGILPGYTPGRDVHRFVSASGGVLDLSGGEPVMRPEFGKAVGKRWVDDANAAARAGGVSGVQQFLVGKHAAGGQIVLNTSRVPDNAMSQPGEMRKMIRGYERDIGSALGKAMGNSVGAAGGQGITGAVGGLTTFNGGRFTELAAKNLRRAQQIAGTMIRVMQGGWRPQTSYSGTSHRGDAVDTQASPAVIRGLRAVGWASGDRTGLGNWASHAHSVPSPATGRGAGSAVWQYQDYMRRGGASQSLGSSWGLFQGTDYASPGVKKIAERGAELVLKPGVRLFRGGEQVLNNQTTRSVVDYSRSAPTRDYSSRGATGGPREIHHHTYEITVTMPETGNWDSAAAALGDRIASDLSARGV